MRYNIHITVNYGDYAYSGFSNREPLLTQERAREVTCHIRNGLHTTEDLMLVEGDTYHIVPANVIRNSVISFKILPVE